MSCSPLMPEFEIPNPQVHAHADQIAETAIYLNDHKWSSPRKVDTELRCS